MGWRDAVRELDYQAALRRRFDLAVDRASGPAAPAPAPDPASAPAPGGI